MTTDSVLPQAQPSTQPMIQSALDALSKLKPDQFELYIESKLSTRIESKDRQIDTLSRAEDTGLSIRVIKNKRQGFSFTTSLDRTSIERAVRSAFEIASVMPEDPFLGLGDFKQFKYPNLDGQYVDPAGMKVSIDVKVELAKKLEDLCRKSDPRIKGVRSAGISESYWNVCMIDSMENRLEFATTLYSADVYCKAEQEGEAQMGSDYEYAHLLRQFTDGPLLNQVAQRSAQNATELLGAKSIPSMQCPVIIRNHVVAELLDFVSASFSAENVDKGRSMLAKSLGKPIFSKLITLTDDGLLKEGVASSPFDGEGVPKTKTALVEQGVMKNLLTDLYYSRKLERPCTGSSSRGIKSPPSIGLSNLILQPAEVGTLPLEKMIQTISKGVVITELLGVHTANPVTGEFSLGASGLRIENGKIAGPVRGFAVAGNILKIFNDVMAVGSDLRFFGSLGTPSIQISQLSVSGT